MAEEARRFPGQERQVIEYYRNNPGAIDGLRAPIYEDKVIDFILELAQVSERAVPLKELLAADAAEGAPDEAKNSEAAERRPDQIKAKAENDESHSRSR